MIYPKTAPFFCLQRSQVDSLPSAGCEDSVAVDAQRPGPWCPYGAHFNHIG